MNAMTPEVSVYELFGASGDALYIGAAADVSARIRWHEAHQEWWSEVDHARTCVTRYPTAWDAMTAERERIASLRPKYNKAGVSSVYIPYPTPKEQRRDVAPYLDRVRDAQGARDAARAEVRAAVLEAVEHGASVRELAAFTGLSTNTVSRWKRGE